MRRVGGLVMLNPNDLPAHLLSAVRERYIHARARVQSRALASGPEEGSIAPLIVGMVALLLLIGSATMAITGAYLQTQSVHVYLSARIRPPLLSVLVPDGIEVSAHGSSRLKMNQGPSTD